MWYICLKPRTPYISLVCNLFLIYSHVKERGKHGFFLSEKEEENGQSVEDFRAFFFFFFTGLTTFDLDKDVHFRIMHLLWKMVTLFIVNKVCKNVDEIPQGV